MSSRSEQQKVDFRNLIFTVCGMGVVLLSLTLFLEKVMRPEPPDALSVSTMDSEKAVGKAKGPTTVAIQPLITWFPSLPDFNDFTDVSSRKAAFIDYLTPIIEYQNSKILRERRYLQNVLAATVNGGLLEEADRSRLKSLAERYEVEWTGDDPFSVILELALRVDIIPVSLAIVQAAKESSWGRSRYAVEANNLFGQWCYDAGCGVVPEDRDPDATHEVRRYKTVSEAAGSYLHNLNTHPRYSSLRRIRQLLRVHGEMPSGDALADGLLYYSQRREAYVEEVKSMIQQYHSFQERRTG